MWHIVNLKHANYHQRYWSDRKCHKRARSGNKGLMLFIILAYKEPCPLEGVCAHTEIVTNNIVLQIWTNNFWAPSGPAGCLRCAMWFLCVIEAGLESFPLASPQPPRDHHRNLRETDTGLIISLNKFPQYRSLCPESHIMVMFTVSR